MKSLQSKSVRVRNALFKKIDSGVFVEGGVLPSERELAENFKVSHATIREAVTQLVASGHVVRMQGKGTFVKKPAPAAVGRPRTVNVYAWDTHGLAEQDPFLAEVLYGAHRALSKSGGHLLRFVAIPRDSRFPDVFKRNKDENANCGALFVAYLPDAADWRIVSERKMRAVSIGKPKEGCPIPFVEINHFQGMRKAVEKFAELGHRRMLFVDVSSDYPSAQDRRKGFEKGLADFACEGRFVPIASMGADEPRERLAAFLGSGFAFSAAVVYGDRPTIGVFKALERHGLRVPDDVSLISYSDYDWIDDACGVKFTKIRQSVPDLAEAACDMLRGEIRETEVWRDTFFLEGNTLRAR